MRDKLWFKARRYGYGWTPCSWEGWTVCGLHCALVIGGAYGADLKAGSYLGLVAVATTLLVWICWKKGEKASWRWGK